MIQDMTLRSSSSLVIVTIVTLAATTGALQPANAESLWGIDVSHHSGDIAWEEVTAEGVDFVYVKATEGIDAADPMFDQHWDALGDLGVRRGAYHFYVTEDDPEDQAEFFLSRVEHEPGDLPPAVDIELIGHGTTGELAPRLRRFLEIVEERVGAVPVIYTGPNFWDAHLDASFGRYPLWIAEYGVDEPRLPVGWSTYAFWQFASDVAVPGIEKSADSSRLHPAFDLESLAVPATD